MPWGRRSGSAGQLHTFDATGHSAGNKAECPAGRRAYSGALVSLGVEPGAEPLPISQRLRTGWGTPR